MTHATNIADTKVVKFSIYGSADVLFIETEQSKQPGVVEVKLRMSAIALNRANALVREGTYLFEASFPSRIGTEGVGTVEEVGPDVVDWSVGQRVNLLPPENESEQGYAAEFVVVSMNKLLSAPRGLEHRSAANAWVPFWPFTIILWNENKQQKDDGLFCQQQVVMLRWWQTNWRIIWARKQLVLLEHAKNKVA
jgi:NADPH:quinone reductase-like Zn-dependent oxidoreductase